MEEYVAMSDRITKKIGKNLKDIPLKLKGWVELVHMRNGEVINRLVTPNVITNAGKAEAAALLLTDVSGTDFDYIAIGTGTTAADATDTALEHEIVTGGGERRGGADVTGSQVTTSVTNDTAQWVTTFTFTSSFAVTESGIFNASSGGDMLCRQTFSAINVSSGDSLQITWKVQCS